MSVVVSVATRIFSAGKTAGVLLGGALLLGVLLRLAMMLQQPFTNDEGAYLYDAKLLLAGTKPGGDIITKAPVVVMAIMASEAVSGQALFAARAVSVLASVVTAVPIMAIATLLGGRRAGMFAGIVWALGGGPIAFHVLGQTEALASLLTVIALALWLAALDIRAALPAAQRQGATGRQVLFAIGAGVALALAFASRKTALAAFLPALFLLWHAPQPWRAKRRHSAWAAVGILIVLLPWSVVTFKLYGLHGLTQVLGIGYGQIVATRLGGDVAALDWGGGPRWVLEVASRAAAAFVALLLAGAAWAISTLGPRRVILSWLGWIGASGVAAFSAYILWRGTDWLLTVYWGLVAVWLLFQSRTRWPPVPPGARVSLVWLAALAGCYALWPTFLPDYLADFFPAVALLGAAVVLALWNSRRSATIAFLAILALGNIAGLASASVRPWTGMFTKDALLRAAVLLQKDVPSREPVFTAAVLVPYLSGHDVLLDIAHPLWYRYPLLDARTSSVFLPSLSEVEEQVASGQVRWALTEHLTDYAYLRHPSDLLAVLQRDWEPVWEIPNDTGFRSNPLTLWKRQE